MIGKEGKEWLEVDLGGGGVHAVQAAESQGRFGNGQGAEFAEAYLLEYFRPRLNKWVRYRTREGKEVLDANSNTYVEVKNELDPVILATKVRFHPYSHYREVNALPLAKSYTGKLHLSSFLRDMVIFRLAFMVPS